MEMRCALVLITFPASEGVFRITGFKSAGSTVVPSHLSPADLAKTKVISVSRRRWPAIVGIASAISKPGGFSPGGNGRPLVSDGHGFGRQQRRPIEFSFGEQRPCHASQFVGQGHGYDVAVGAGCEL